MKLEHVYINIEGKDYFDYTLYCNDSLVNGWKSFPDLTGKEYFVCDYDLINKLQQAETLVDNTKYPPKSSCIYITPNLPYPIEDIRQNYTIKRTVDAGDYNVIGPISLRSNYSYFYGIALAVYPSIKTIFLTDDREKYSEREVYAQSCIYISNPDFDDMVYKKYNYWHRFDVVIGQPVYKKLLDGTLIKPCVPYTNLDIAGKNPLTNDILTLVTRMGEPDLAVKDAEKNFIIQLNVLNQHNWREYPGTITMLLNEMMVGNRCSVIHYMRNHKSRYSKVVKELLTNKPVEFLSQKDMDFERQYLDTLINVGDCRFTTACELNSKLASINLSLDTFNKLYNNIVRLTPKKYGE